MIKTTLENSFKETYWILSYYYGKDNVDRMSIDECLEANFVLKKILKAQSGQ